MTRRHMMEVKNDYVYKRIIQLTKVACLQDTDKNKVFYIICLHILRAIIYLIEIANNYIIFTVQLYP